MNTTTRIANIGAEVGADGRIEVLNFTVLAEDDGGRSAHFDMSQMGGDYAPPATPRTPIMAPIMEPVFEPVMEPIMVPIMEPTMEPVFETMIGADGEPRQVQVGERQIGEHQVGERQIGEKQVGQRQVGERQVGEKIVGYEGGYTQDELAAIAAIVAQSNNAYDEALSRLESLIPKPSLHVPAPPYVPNDEEKKQMLADQIDGKVAYIYRQFTQFQVEYELREAAARAYKDAGYTGPLGPLVADYAESSGMSNQQAADATIYMADQLRAALPQLGVLRMRKNRILRAATLGEAHAEFDEVMSGIEAIERELP